MTRFTRHIVVAAIALAAFAPAAGAAVYQHSLGLTQSVATTNVAYVHSAGANPSSYLAAFDAPTRATYTHSPDLNPYRHLEAFNPSPSTPTVSVAPGSSFDWADAGIGAGALAALLLLAGAMAIVVRKTGSRRLAV